MSSSPDPSSVDRATRERSLVIVSAWTLDTGVIPAEVMPKTRKELQALVLDIGLVAAAVIHAWAGEVDADPHQLLSEIAIGQAILDVTRDTVEQ